MILQSLFKQINSMDIITTIYTIPTTMANASVIFFNNNDFIKQYYADSRAFSLVVRLTNLDDTKGGICYQFNTNQNLGTTSNGNTTYVYGYYGIRAANSTVTSTYRITSSLSTTSTSAFALYGNSSGRLIGESGSGGSAYQPGIYFVIFGLMTNDSLNNLIPSSLNYQGFRLFNNVGYQNGCILREANNNIVTGSSYTDYVSTGAIAYIVPSVGLPPTIYVKGAEWTNSQYCRLFFYKNTNPKALIDNVKCKGNTDFSNLFTVTQLGNKYYKFEPVVDGTSSKLYTTSTDTILYFRMTLASSDGANLKVSFNPLD